MMVGLNPKRWEALQFDEAVLALADRVDNAARDAVNGAKDQKSAESAAERAVNRILHPEPQRETVSAATSSRVPPPAVEYAFTPDGDITVRQKPS